jgi:starch synthase
MKILLASSEAVPFAKTGELADVTGALPRALAQMGHEVYLLLPKYRQVDEKRFRLTKTGTELQIPISHRTEKGDLYVWEAAPNFQVIFIRKDAYYDREYLYGPPNGDFEDNAERFIFFSRAVLEAAQALDLQPDVIHCHDWQTGLIPVYLKTAYRSSPSLSRTASLLTIHNIGYQGLFWHYDLEMTNLGWELFTPQALEFYGKINFLKGGIVFADAISTVSRKHMEEIQTPEFGCGLQGVLRGRRQDLWGIGNGVDYEDWDPARDPLICEHYDASRLDGKKLCKADLQREFGLPVEDRIPLIGSLSTLSDQKGFDLLSRVMEDLIPLGAQFVFLGTGEEKYHQFFSGMGEKYPAQVALRLGLYPEAAHKIEAGADMLLMPSRCEPWGQDQIYSLKYGTVPIVRATGGLDDTVEDFNPRTGDGNGFKFKEYSPACLVKTVERAVQFYRQGDVWERLMIRGMSADFSWEKSAREYLDLYEKTRARKQFRELPT